MWAKAGRINSKDNTEKITAMIPRAVPVEHLQHIVLLTANESVNLFTNYAHLIIGSNSEFNFPPKNAHSIQKLICNNFCC